MKYAVRARGGCSDESAAAVATHFIAVEWRCCGTSETTLEVSFGVGRRSGVLVVALFELWCVAQKVASWEQRSGL